MTRLLTHSCFVPSKESQERSVNVTNISLGFPRELIMGLRHQEGNESIGWIRGGTAWKILDMESFSSNVLPLFTGGRTRDHFNQFIHLLLVWGFKLDEGAAFSNPLFQRDNSDLLAKMEPNRMCPLEYQPANHDSSQEQVEAHRCFLREHAMGFFHDLSLIHISEPTRPY